jgi:arabinose-5-phosphate isomerase
MLALGDALAVVLAGCKGFDEAAFARIHPAGNLGRQLRRVAELMQREGLPIVPEGTPVRQVLRVILAGHNRGVAIIVDAAGVLSGILVDGDLKRLLLRHGDLLDLPVETVMTRRPRTISRDACIGEALSIMEGRITSLLVVDREGRPEGLLHVHDILEMRVI